jgi:ADP-heptose:LPS heptosyltransferase
MTARTQWADTFRTMRLKRLELWWRALWIRILVRLMRRASNEKPDWGARPFRVLFLRHDRAGDMILSTGVMRAIARSHATITLDVLAAPANASIIDTADYIAHVVVFDKKRLSSYLPTALQLRRAKYDAVIDCMVTAPSLTTLLLIFASGAEYRVGIAGRGNDAAFNVTVPAEPRADAHIVDLLAALGAAFGVEPTRASRQPVLNVTPSERDWAELTWGDRASGVRALINVSAGTAERQWGNEEYAAVMQHIHDRHPHTTIKVIGAPAEMDRAGAIARLGGGALAPTPGIRHAFALVATADIVVTPDTSIAHAASALETPCVAIYVSNKAERWGLYGTVGENVQHPAPTMHGLTADRVIRAVDAVWENSAISRGD